MPQDKQPITFYLSSELIKELDKSAKSVNMSRSQFVSWLLTEALPMIGPVSQLMKDVFKQTKKEK